MGARRRFSLERLAADPDAVIISLGMSELLDLKMDDTIRLKGAGFDHERLMTIVGVGSRLPGFPTRSRATATAPSLGRRRY